ncbi:MAG TPA: hypothetical protein VLX91_02135 [Candidatus Acidoferrales bacterium]|nr:hypothetical protein [Candidatus Acidoferrales bacterium]
MNFILAILVIIGAPKGPQVFYYDGTNLTKLNPIFVPNIGNEIFQLFVKSSYELKYASIDSSGVGMCLVDQAAMKEMKLRGRWYKISWETQLSPGSKQHVIFLTAFSGIIFKRNFIVNVEGTRKLEKPAGGSR